MTTTDLSHFGRFFSFNNQKNKNSNDKIFNSPRRSSPPILMKLCNYETNESLSNFHHWIQSNIIRYLNEKNNWIEGIFPQRLLYLYGIEGIGKLSMVVLNCIQHNINLIYVNHHYFVDSMHETILLKAKENMPCIIYYDQVDGMIGHPNRNTPFTAMFNVLVDIVKDDIWVVLAGTNNVTEFPTHVSTLIDQCGSVIYAPIPLSEAYKTEVFMKMLRYLAGSDDFPYKSYDAGAPILKEWDRFISQIIRTSEYCSFRNIWDFLVVVFRDFNHSKLPMNETKSRISQYEHNINRYPDISLFQRRYEMLPFRRDVNCDDIKTLLVGQPEPSARWYNMNNIYDIYTSYRPAEQMMSTAMIINQPIKSHTTPVPICEDDIFTLNEPKFSSKPPLPPLPQIKSSLQLKKPSINTIKRSRVQQEHEHDIFSLFDNVKQPRLK